MVLGTLDSSSAPGPKTKLRVPPPGMGPALVKGRGSDGWLEPGSFPGPLWQMSGQPESPHYLTDLRLGPLATFAVGAHGDAVTVVVWRKVCDVSRHGSGAASARACCLTGRRRMSSRGWDFGLYRFDGAQSEYRNGKTRNPTTEGGS